MAREMPKPPFQLASAARCRKATNPPPTSIVSLFSSPSSCPTMGKTSLYSHSANNSTTSLSDNDEDEGKDLQLSIYPVDVAPAHWHHVSRESGPRPLTPHSSPASHLPPEILIHVLRQLHSTRDLHSALLTSRSWCECAVELLWHRPSFTDTSRFVQMLQVIGSEDRMFDYARFVRRLNLFYLGRELTDSLFTRLTRCVKLERLNLANCVEISDEALQKVLTQCSNLTAIDLSGVVPCTDKSIIALAKVATKLQGINLGGCKNVTDEGIIALAVNCPLLRRIKLINIREITDMSVSALAKHCSLLLEVDLNGCPKVTDQAVRDIWVYVTHLRDFRLAQCAELTDLAFPADPKSLIVETQAGIQPFPSALLNSMDIPQPLRLNRICEHLRMLDLTSLALITDDAVAGIIASAPKIRSLVLAKCSQLTDIAVENICKLGRHLHYLHLGHASSITDNAVRMLARSCTRLRYIDLACCPLLTDMSVHELATLSKLRRIGLVRVTNLTDQAIYSLADRHSTLERIHLSYCENITVIAVHFLLQNLSKLTHLSLTGIPAFRRQELQQFCRPPPREFNTNQRAAFCVYSGKGVHELRNYLNDLMTSVQAADDVGDNDTDYDAGEDDDSGDMTPYTYTRIHQARHGAQIGHHEMVMTPRAVYGPPDIWRASTASGTIINNEEVFADVLPNATVRARLANRRNGTPSEANPPVEDTHPSSMSTTPSPPRQPTSQAGSASGRHRSRGFGQDLIIEPPSPAPQPQLATYIPRPTMFSLPAHQDLRSSSKVSDAGSAHSSGTNNTNVSNGASFFRTYQNRAGQAGEMGSGGMYTPDLVFAEIGHGRGREGRDVMAGPGPSTMMQAAWHSESDTSSPNDEMTHGDGDLAIRSETDLSLHGRVEGKRVHNMDRASQQTLPDPHHPLYRSGLATSHETLPWATRRDEHDPNSPIPYLSASPTTRELHESVQAALSGSRPGSSSASASAQGLSSEEMVVDGRGRSVKRSLRNTLSAAEQYASALFFGRNGSSGTSSLTSMREPGTPSGPSANGTNGRLHNDRH